MSAKRSGAFLMVAALAVACGKPPRIGVVLPESGQAGVYGASIRQGVELALTAGGPTGSALANVPVDYRDSGSDPTTAARLAEELYRAGALIVIGGATSAEAEAMVAVANREEKVLLSPSASAPDLAPKSVYFFRMCPSDDVEGARAAKVIADGVGQASVAVLEEDSALAHNLAPVVVRGLQSRGVKVLDAVSTATHGWQTALHRQLQANRPGAAYICGSGGTIEAGVRALRDDGFDGLICTTSRVAAREVVKALGSRGEGIVFPMVAIDLFHPERPVARQFADAFLARYHVHPDIFAAEGYDCGLAASAVMRDIRVRSGGEVQLRLKALGQTSGVTGALAFDDYGNIQHYPRTYWIHDGNIEDHDAYIESRKEELRRRADELIRGGSGG